VRNLEPQQDSESGKSVAERWRRFESAPSALQRETINLKRAWRRYACGDSRRAIYLYLDPVFCAAKKLSVAKPGRYLSANHGADLFSTLIERSADKRIADRKMRSKWCRALRFAAKSKSDDECFTDFVVRNGGINQCAHAQAVIAKACRR
jgi:hypothetical protein